MTSLQMKSTHAASTATETGQRYEQAFSHHVSETSTPSHNLGAGGGGEKDEEKTFFIVAFTVQHGV